MSGATFRHRARTYPAPDTAPTGCTCRVLRIPDDPRIISAVSDVLAYLSLPDVWEPSPALDDAAMQALLAAMVDAYFTESCEVPVLGEIITLPYSLNDPKWHQCDGSYLSIEDYAELFNAVGYAFGSLSEGQLFRLPDLRNRVPVGAGAAYAVGDQFGVAQHILTVDEMPSHAHGTQPHNHTTQPHAHTTQPHSHSNSPHGHGSIPARAGASNTPGDNLIMRGAANTINASEAIATASVTINNTTVTVNSAGVSVDNANVQVNNAGGGAAHENRQPSLALLYYIRVLP